MVQLRNVWRGLAALALMGALVVAPAVADPAPEPKGVSEDDAKWLLPDAEVIFKLNIKQMMGSELMKKGGIEHLKQAINSNEQAKTLLEAAGLDVTKDVDSILASAAGTSAKDARTRVVVKGRFNPEKVGEALKKRDDVKVSKEGATQLYEVPVHDQTMFAAFADKNTVVLAHNKDAVVNAVKEGGKKAVPVSKDMSKALSRFTGKESMAVAVVISDDVKKMIANAPRVGESAAKLQTVTAALTITDSVTFNLTGITGNEKAAKSLGNLLQILKAAAAESAGDQVPKGVVDILDAVKVASDKESVKVDLKVTKDMIEKANKPGG